MFTWTYGDPGLGKCLKLHDQCDQFPSSNSKACADNSVVFVVVVVFVILFVCLFFVFCVEQDSGERTIHFLEVSCHEIQDCTNLGGVG